MNKDAAEKEIQHLLAQVMETINAEVLPLAREHGIEFSFLGLTYRLFPRNYREGKTHEVWNKETQKYDYMPYTPAKEGLLVSDDEWYSSSFGCEGRYWEWHSEQWPSGEE